MNFYFNQIVEFFDMYLDRSDHLDADVSFILLPET